MIASAPLSRPALRQTGLVRGIHVSITTRQEVEAWHGVLAFGDVGLGNKLAKYPTLLDLFRAQAVGEARAAATGKPDYSVNDVEMLPPLLAP